MQIKDLTAAIEEMAPLPLQEDFDNSGLLIGSKDTEIKRALITLDVTEAVLQEAIAGKCDLIISHHPLIFHGIKRLTGEETLTRIITKAIRENIAIYAAHTNLDNAGKGLNASLCSTLGIRNTKVLLPQAGKLLKLITFCPVDHAEKVRMAIFEAGAGHIGNYDCCSFNLVGNGTFRGSDETNPFVGEKNKVHTEKEVRVEVILPSFLKEKVVRALIGSHPYEEVAYDLYPLANDYPVAGSGMIGELENPEEEIAFLGRIRSILGLPVVRHSGLTGKPVQRIAVCSGAGSFLIKEAMKNKADAFLTADLKYHEFFEGENRMLIADIGHYESEKGAKELIYSVLNKKFPTFALLISETDTNSVHYL